ncbi:bifunctional pyr operon transcriptional regulator/uracil phosphoribosyltransferase PyrR [Cumulibacter manganitolerans]|uniref:bifunctional pyr operon transcriptional regulator/uracil phosphoribosyltransferase PyrR n=1 Tax=Cumulibacter manganitolerans TaxID=1884992 RepID=UPI001296B8ED|nr:bifunctional pyr operon transcriptional regulator/uracil phosphoribosyltransferase PyrR [Cumulibacter manganitolerans]
MGIDPESAQGSGARSERVILTADEISRVIDRISHQILEKTDGASNVVLVGIPTRGAQLAARIQRRIAAFSDVQPPVGVLDITLYRDDLRTRGVRPLERTREPEGGIDGKTVILVDDVLYSGRTIRAALDALRDWGRPQAIQLAVLVDRGHRELPIRADYVGKNIPTSRDEQVFVAIAENDGADGVAISDHRPSREQIIALLTGGGAK